MAKEIISWRGKMRSIKSILLSFLFLLPITYYLLPCTSYAEELTITTYYPSPYGSYNELGINKLAVDINRVAVPSEYAAMQNGDAHIGRSLIVGSGGGSGFAYDELTATTRPTDGDVMIRNRLAIGSTELREALHVRGKVLINDTWEPVSTYGYDFSRLYIYSRDNPAILTIHSCRQGQFGKAGIDFRSDPLQHPYLWRPASIRSMDNGSFTGGLIFYVNGTGEAHKEDLLEAMRIVNGNVSIGGFAPSYPLHIRKDGAVLRIEGVGSNGITITPNYIGHNYNEISTNMGEDIALTNLRTLLVGTAITDIQWKLKVNGDTYIAGKIERTGTCTRVSDIRLKKGIVELNDVLAKLKKIRPVEFYWRTKEFPDRNFSKEKQIGVIAQEVEKEFPELVSTNHDGYKSVNNDGLAVVLLKAIKEQQQEIDSLKQEIAALKKK